VLSVTPCVGVDLAVIAAVSGRVTWFGPAFAGPRKRSRIIFWAGRTAPWWAIALSIVAAETSTTHGDSDAAALVSGRLRIPTVGAGISCCSHRHLGVVPGRPTFAGELFTAYELMRRRFGSASASSPRPPFLVLRPWPRGRARVRHHPSCAPSSWARRNGVHRAILCLTLVLHL